MRLDTYLFFKGDCEKAFKLYEQALGGKIEAMLRHQGSPAEGSVPREWGNKIIHARLRVGDAVLMASDAPPPHQPASMQGFYVSVTVPTAADADRIFNALLEGGEVREPIQKTFFSARFGMLVDQFGVPWMINCEQAP